MAYTLRTFACGRRAGVVPALRSDVKRNADRSRHVLARAGQPRTWQGRSTTDAAGLYPERRRSISAGVERCDSFLD